jgi:hypothetical protein
MSRKFFACSFKTKTSLASPVVPFEFFLAVSLVIVILESTLKYCLVAGSTSGIMAGMPAIKLFFLSKQITNDDHRLPATALAKR